VVRAESTPMTTAAISTTAMMPITTGQDTRSQDTDLPHPFNETIQAVERKHSGDDD
jgi:hypothetical protein